VSDNLIMKFGKYKGRDMDNVPADYLDWLIGQDWIGNWPDVMKYITDHKASIHVELVRSGKLDEERDF
jgi:uncharacterized protein (DUF3820 family)